MQQLEFVPNELLVDKKFGIKDDDKVYVSPAVFQLITQAESDAELTKIIRHLDSITLNDTMIRASIHNLESILPFIGETERINLDNDSVRVTSLRLLCFKLHGIKCVKCGIEGKFFAKEKTKKDVSYHLNLYAVRENEEILMTKDHIVPKCKGGKENIENMQTMCCECNEEKGGK